MSKLLSSSILNSYINEKINHALMLINQDIENMNDLIEEWEYDLTLQDIDDYLIVIQEKIIMVLKKDFFKEDNWLNFYLQEKDLEIQRHTRIKKSVIYFFDGIIIDAINRRINSNKRRNNNDLN